MKNQKWLSLVQMLLAPGLLVVLGLILIVAPDSASALVQKVVAWALILFGTGMGLKNLLHTDSRSVGEIVAAAVSLVIGLWLVSKDPLFLAAGIGRLIGIVILLQSIDLRDHGTHMHIGSLITAVIGFVLIVVPMTLSKVVFIGLGIVCFAVGIIEIADRLHRSARLPKGDDDVIDVEKL